MWNVLRRLRDLFGTSASKPGIIEAIIKRKRNQDPHFNKEISEFDDGNGDDIIMYLEFTEEIDVLLDFIYK